MDEQTDTQAPPPPVAPPVRRLVRRMDQRKLGGVAAGIADYVGVDPLLIRILFVATAFLGGFGILVYVLGWIFMPTADGPTAPSHEAWRTLPAPAWLGIGIGLLGVVLLAAQIGRWHADIVWAVILILVGVALYRRSTEHAAARAVAMPAPPVATPPAPAASSAIVPASPASTVTAPIPATVTEPVARPVEARRREHSVLGWLTLGTLMLALGGLALLQAAGVLFPTPTHYLALAVAIIGAGLLVGTVLGSAKWLIALGVVLTPFLLAASLVHVPYAGGTGAHAYQPPTQAELLSTYRLTAGQLVLNLRHTAFEPGSTTTVTATNVVGQIVVAVPPDVTVEVHARVSGGEVRLLGETFDGAPIDVRRSFPADGTATRLVLELQTSFGEVVVRR